MSETTTPARPVTTTIQAVWQGEQRYEVGRPGGPTSTIDADARVAPGPVDTLLAAVASCSGVDIVEILAKRRTPVERFAITVTAERRPTPPRRVVRMEIEYRIDGAGIEAEHAERAIALSFEKYCSVAASLAPDIVTHTRLTLNGESHPPVRRVSGAPAPGSR